MSNANWMDYSKIVENIAEAVARSTTPLSGAQKMVMAGAMSVWIDAAFKAGQNTCKLKDSPNE